MTGSKINIEAKLKGSSEASAVPIRKISVSASLAGRSSAGSQQRPKANPEKTKT